MIHNAPIIRLCISVKKSVQLNPIVANDPAVVFKLSNTFTPLFRNVENHQTYYHAHTNLDPSLHPI